MTIRTTQSIVRFRSAFSLPDFDTPLPPGEYLVDRDEEALEGDFMTAWRRVATFIHLPAKSTKGTTHQLVPIDHTVLEAVLEQDNKRL